MAKKWFRPWNVDAIAEVKKFHQNGTIEIEYEHDRRTVHVLDRRSADVIGRFVNREDYRPVVAAT